MIGGTNAYHAGWMTRGRKIGDTDGDGSVDTVRQHILKANLRTVPVFLTLHNCAVRCCKKRAGRFLL
eukprot:COSAG02_NODE_3959_length_5983_cov_9.304176_2_plen_67_part_00